jgi:UDP-N-acetylmuramate: L-alanyl-gamma-D-glutamyl-meso-diaminopimelate ligase
MLAWILERAGRDPGFLIGGIPSNFGVSARAGDGSAFVIEADEYDTAFFDKRAKFVHYRPGHLLMTNLEFDHADIYPDLAAIQKQFHHLLRTVPGRGRVTWNAADANLAATLAMGCWTPLTGFSREPREGAEWSVRLSVADGSAFEVLRGGKSVAALRWPLIGMHNVENGLAAIACAAGAGVAPDAAAAALGEFAGVRRRMELRGEVDRIRVYDDFAHHPTAIALTVDGLRRNAGRSRIVAVLEPRSNTMRLGVHRAELPKALAGADRVWLFQPAGLDWKLDDVAHEIGAKAAVATELPALVAALDRELTGGDHVLIMSNGGFGGLHEKLLQALRARRP